MGEASDLVVASVSYAAVAETAAVAELQLLSPTAV
jgi:hypothetical protein